MHPSPLVALLIAAFPPAPAPSPDSKPEPAPAIRAVLTEPEKQGEALLSLFHGARVPNPPAALAAWKRATGGRGGLNKPLEAVLSMLNPGMVRETRAFNQAALMIGFEPGTGRPHWRALAPHDDGTIAALTESLMLTSGTVEPPLDGATVLRLGPPGAALAANGPGGLVMASDREQIRLALASTRPTAVAGDTRPGLHVYLDPSGLRDLTTLAGRRSAEALNALGCRQAVGWLALTDDTLGLNVRTTLGPGVRSRGVIDPAWLDAIPAGRVLAAAALAIDTAEEPLAALFKVLDRIDRADPARAGLAPLRTRLNVLSSVARVRLETDLWPNLRGATFALLSDGAGRIGGFVLALHASDEAAAKHLADQVVPRLLASFLKVERAGEPGPDRVIVYKSWRGRPLRLVSRRSSVLLGWGDDALTAALAACDEPSRSSGAVIRAGWGATPPARAGAFWPGRWRDLAPTGSPLANALETAPPILWSGRSNGETLIDIVQWKGLRDLVRRGLELLPLQPPHPS